MYFIIFNKRFCHPLLLSSRIVIHILFFLSSFPYSTYPMPYHSLWCHLFNVLFPFSKIKRYPTIIISIHPTYPIPYHSHFPKWKATPTLIISICIWKRKKNLLPPRDPSFQITWSIQIMLRALFHQLHNSYIEVYELKVLKIIKIKGGRILTWAQLFKDICMELWGGGIQYLRGKVLSFMSVLWNGILSFLEFQKDT